MCNWGNGRFPDFTHFFSDTRDVRNELLIVLYLDIHVRHDKNQYIPI